MVGKSGESIPFIFLITDGAVEDEKDICNIMKDHLLDGGINSPRIFTFGIGMYVRLLFDYILCGYICNFIHVNEFKIITGSYCNHYFLQMLAHMGRGCHDAAYDVGQFHTLSSTTNIYKLYPMRVYL